MSKADDANWVERCNTLFNAWVQVRYHKRRQRFFDLADKITKSLTVLVSASLIGLWLKECVPYMAAGISFLGLLALIFGYGDRKQQHKELGEAAANLIADIEAIPATNLDAEKVASFKSRYANLCAKAPPPLKTLTVICEHEQSVVNGYPDHKKRPCLCNRLLADFIN
jgi:hypothetical protein